MNTQGTKTEGCCSQSHCSRLLSEGWREYPDGFRKYARCFFKRFDTPTRCSCNLDKLGIQICIAVSEHEGKTSYEIDLCGELPDATWIKFRNYSMPEDIEQGLATIPRLLETWEFICAMAKTQERYTARESSPTLATEFRK